MLNTVRAFYQDIARWAATTRSAGDRGWRRSPVRVNETSHVKARSRRKADMDQRTRTLLPVLPPLWSPPSSSSTETRPDGSLLPAASPGVEFALDGETYRRRGGE